jgi:group I intron endonuclease
MIFTKENILKLNKNVCGIYFLINTTNGKIYVGSSVDVRKRLLAHMAHLRKNKHDNNYFQHAWNLEKENFICLVVENVSRENITEREQHYIDLLNVTNRDFGYNLAPIANKPFMSEDGRKRISESNYRRLADGEDFGKGMRGKHHTEEHKAYMSQLFKGSGNPMYGIHLSKEKSASWKGGKPKCKNCGKLLTQYHYKECFDCISKRAQKLRDDILEQLKIQVPVKEIAENLKTCVRYVNRIRKENNIPIYKKTKGNLLLCH